MVYDASDMVMRKLAVNQSSQRSQKLGKLQSMRRERPARNGFGRQSFGFPVGSKLLHGNKFKSEISLNLILRLSQGVVQIGMPLASHGDVSLLSS